MDGLLGESAETELENGLEESLREGDELRGIPDFLQATDDVGEPDLSSLAQTEEDPLDDPFEFKTHDASAELSDDPVRLYLREIGLVKLLDSDSEFRLSTCIEAERLLMNLWLYHCC
jgi:RNA polymerase primary sigma factor